MVQVRQCHLENEMRHKKGFVQIFFILVAGLVIGAMGVIVWSRLTGGQVPFSAKKGKVVRISKLRSKAPGVISAVISARDVSAQTGEPKVLSSKFSKKEGEIFVVMKLQEVKPGTKLEYVRYLNNKYLDHKSIEITRANAGYANFSWKLKDPPGIRATGEYFVKVYTNGKLEKTITYSVS